VGLLAVWAWSRFEIGWSNDEPAACLVLQQSEQLAGDVADQAAFDLAVGLALGAPPLSVGAGRWVIAQPGQDDEVQGLVELAVSGSVEPNPDRLAAGGRDGAAPPSMAKAASLGQRPGCDQAHSTMAATIGPPRRGLAGRAARPARAW
jgi:hypothetical protein